MKRLFILIAVCMIGMVLPQGVFAAATVTVSDGTVTINTDKAGDLKAYLQSASDADKAAIRNASSIVFDGKFNKDDLEALKNAECCTQSTVDMSEAKFVKGAGVGGQDEGPYLYHDLDAMNNNAQGKKKGDRCIVGAVFYKSNKDYSTGNSNPPFEWMSLQGGSEDYTNNNRMLTQYPWYTSKDDAPDPTDYGLYMYAGGKEYEFKGPAEGWVEVSSQGGDEELDFKDMSFKYWGSNVTKAITSKYVDPTKPLDKNLCTGCSALQDLTINSGTIHKIYEGNTKPPLQKVTIGNRVAQIGNGEANGGFGNFSSITEVAFDENGDDPVSLVFKGSSFISCSSLTGISFPARTTLIEANAFSTCNSLTTVTFEHDTQFTDPLIIRSMAFQNCGKIKDVYINVNSDEKLLICEYNAFSFDAMEAQTQVDGEMATLHFPEDTNDHPDNFEFYAGEWKKGMAFSQSELNSFKDGLQVTVGGQNYVGDNIVQDPNNFNFGGQNQRYTAIWKYDNIDGYYHPSDYPNTKYAPANGWQQFAKTDSKREIYITGNVYMTYSTNKPYSLPTGIIAFRVTDYVEAGTAENGKTKNGKLVLKMINQVPVETGMLLISTNQYKVTASEVAQNPDIQTKFYFGDPVGDPQIYHYTMGAEGDATSNYLAPAVHGIAVGPVSKGVPNAVTGAINVDERPFTHRNFILRKSDHWFVRTTKGTMPDNRAFLSLPIGKFTNDNESDMEGPLPWNTQAGKALTDYDPTQASNNDNNAKTNLFFEYDVEEYGMIWPLAMMDGNMGITTSISPIQQEKANNGIYTLQGVKVSATSTKGIYIVNGKKVIIK